MGYMRWNRACVERRSLAGWLPGEKSIVTS